jgi:hypothetical protein
MTIRSLFFSKKFKYSKSGLTFCVQNLLYTSLKKRKKIQNEKVLGFFIFTHSTKNYDLGHLSLV